MLVYGRDQQTSGVDISGFAGLMIPVETRQHVTLRVF